MTESVALETKTDGEGIYTFSCLPPGTYTIKANGFWLPKKIAGYLLIIKVQKNFNRLIN